MQHSSMNAAALQGSWGKRLLATCVCSLATCGVVSAADAPQRPPAVVDSYIPVAPSDDSLYQALGGHEGLVKIAADFHHRLEADPQLDPYFRDIDGKQYQERLVIQFCEVSGGPCKQAKYDMRKIHSGMDINKATFNATVEVLQQAMDAQGIAYRTQNRLLAQLAPMHRDIINVP